jgi:hypothetical protein
MRNASSATPSWLVVIRAARMFMPCAASTPESIAKSPGRSRVQTANSL